MHLKIHFWKILSGDRIHSVSIHLTVWNLDFDFKIRESETFGMGCLGLILDLNGLTFNGTINIFLSFLYNKFINATVTKKNNPNYPFLIILCLFFNLLKAFSTKFSFQFAFECRTYFRPNYSNNMDQ